MVSLKVPVIVVPGITGTRLRDGESGKLVWGSARNVFFPRDGGYRLALRVISRTAVGQRQFQPGVAPDRLGIGMDLDGQFAGRRQH